MLLPWWQMELPHIWADVFALYNRWTQPPVTADRLICDRWNDHLFDWLMLLPWWQMELATVGMYKCIKADVITLLADVIAMGLYFNFSSVLLTRTSSHI